MMRTGTVFTARGIVRAGSFASPAVIPMISVPPNANITIMKLPTNPASP
ncbi:Uncharacterised protein [Mycobacteroides abscessus subsp. abscessus]|nr:Uncharacterised protein [Mycobacteroides abscessus subsp. abscessus]